jgi:hypothetical protein
MLRIRETDVHQQAKEDRQMCTSRIKRGWPDMHQQAKEKRARYAPASTGEVDRCAPAGLE